MDILRPKFSPLWLLLLLPLISGCQATYLVENGYYQLKILNNRTPIDKVLEENKLSDKQKKKLLLAKEARVFAETELKLEKTENYQSFVQLDGPYVTHVLSASPRFKLENYKWSFPFFGSFPYKGFFNKESAKTAQKNMKKRNYDTYVRGVTAFSTLGWFDDPILSSMLSYSNYDLVNLIIHETVHATIYIKSAADFNERLATFVGNKGTELFYIKKEGFESPTLQKIRDENKDTEVFSQFISTEVENLKIWYQENQDKFKNKELTETDRTQRFKEIQRRFLQEAKPSLKTSQYLWFSKVHLNNARLLVLNTYTKDLDDFEAVYRSLNSDFEKLIEYCKSLENFEDPEKELKAKAKSVRTSS